MSESKSRSDDPVMTQSDLPPGIDAPANAERELRRLAERVGGRARLREVATALAAGAR